MEESLAVDDRVAGTGSGRPGFPVDLYRLGRALLGAKRLIIGAGVFGLMVGFVVATFVVSDRYESTAVLKYEGDIDVPGLPQRPGAFEPAADALYSQPVLARIREQGGFQAPLFSLAAAIDHRMSRRSETIEIIASSETAEDAADFARLVTDVFMEYHSDRQSRRLDAELTRIRKRIVAAEEESGRARKRYNEFRERHGIADLSTEQTSMLEAAAERRADSELAVAEVQGLEAEAESLRKQLATTTKTTVIGEGSSPEREAYSELREQLATARATLSRDHPRVKALEHQVAQLRDQIRSDGSGVGRLVGVNVAYQSIEARLLDAQSRLAAARARQEGLLALATHAADRVESFSEIEGEAAALLAEVKVNEALVTNLHRTETAIEDAMRDPPSGFVVLDAGAVPEYPERSKKKLAVFAMIPMLAVGLALLIAFRREFGDLAPLTPVEIAFWGNGPVVGATSWPEDPHGLDELVAALDDLAPEATGQVLVVGASESASVLAKEFTDQINRDWSPTMASVSPAPEPEPTVTPAPPRSGPYPLGGPATSAALARRPSVATLRRMDPPPKSHGLRFEAWEGHPDGQPLRRAARLADRVVVLVVAGRTPLAGLAGTGVRIGRRSGVGYIVVGLPEGLRSVPDRVGDVPGFWGVPGPRR